MSHKQSVIKFGTGADKMEIIVGYDSKEPENYTVNYAYHNGKDVSDFYRFCESRQECILYPQIIEGIASDICTERMNKRQISKSKLQIT